MKVRKSEVKKQAQLNHSRASDHVVPSLLTNEFGKMKLYFDSKKNAGWMVTEPARSKVLLYTERL